ncbi:hypothetical protein [Streptomyces sp. TLI_171]|uniref:hypothetical protein n=1 Tax=Streptomyces sp. TLI_171 TaxID=1938859 RepID=UPI000FF44CFE|nr:hypothetical protein [Streptomyces sp. TLI_171]RKE23288.1 hypothetical protein BX266_6750 [Streptomyces sp. TLI_171]
MLPAPEVPPDPVVPPEPVLRSPELEVPSPLLEEDSFEPWLPEDSLLPWPAALSMPLRAWPPAREPRPSRRDSVKVWPEFLTAS